MISKYDIREEKVIEYIEKILDHLSNDLRQEYNDYESELHLIGDDNTNFLYTGYYIKNDIDTDFLIYLKNKDDVFSFDFFGFDYIDGRWVVFRENPERQFLLNILKINTLWKIIHMIIKVPSVSSFLNEKLFKHINK